MQSDFERIKECLRLQQVISQETGLAMKGPHLEQCPFCGGHGEDDAFAGAGKVITVRNYAAPVEVGLK